MRLRVFALLLLLAALPAHAERLTVFAAASLKEALDEIISIYPGKAIASYGASSMLARQIERGAPADVFISADRDWMDYLDRKSLLIPGTRRDLLRNHLVLISPASSPVKLQPAPGFPIARALGNGRLALAEPGSVPAGRYAKAALEKLGVWPQVANRVAGAENVRAALALVARGEAPLGIVYRTDALAEPRVAIAGTFPDDAHPPIVYPAAAIAGRTSGPAFLSFLSSPEAKRIFEKHGFAVN